MGVGGLFISVGNIPRVLIFSFLLFFGIISLLMGDPAEIPRKRKIKGVHKEGVVCEFDGEEFLCEFNEAANKLGNPGDGVILKTTEISSGRGQTLLRLELEVHTFDTKPFLVEVQKRIFSEKKDQYRPGNKLKVLYNPNNPKSMNVLEYIIFKGERDKTFIPKVPAEAYIVKAEKSGWIINDEPVLNLELQIHMEKVPLYNVIKKKKIHLSEISLFKTGNKLKVMCNPHDKNSIIILDQSIEEISLLDQISSGMHVDIKKVLEKLDELDELKKRVKVLEDKLAEMVKQN